MDEAYLGIATAHLAKTGDSYKIKQSGGANLDAEQPNAACQTGHGARPQPTQESAP